MTTTPPHEIVGCAKKNNITVRECYRGTVDQKKYWKFDPPKLGECYAQWQIDRLHISGSFSDMQKFIHSMEKAIEDWHERMGY